MSFLRSMVARVFAGTQPAGDSAPMGRKKRGNMERSPFPPLEENVGELVKSMRRDYQAVICLGVISAAVMKANIRFECPDTSNTKAAAIAKHLNEILAIEMRNLLEGLEFGRYAFQWKTWKNDTTSGTTLGTPELIEAYDRSWNQYSWRLAEGSEFRGIKIPTEDIEWDESRTGWIAFWATTINPYGESIYDGAPSVARASRIGMFKLREKFVTKSVTPLREVHCPEIVKDPETGEDVDNFAATAAEIKAAENYGLFFAGNARTADGEWETTLGPQPQGQDPSGMEMIIGNTDAEISRAFGVHEELVGKNSSAGSNGAMTVHQETVNGQADLIAVELIKQLNEQWLKPHIERNFPGGKNPGIVCTATTLLNSSEATETKTAVSIATNNTLPPLVTSGGIDLIRVMQKAGIPLTADAKARFEETLAMIKEAQAGKAGAVDVNQPGGSGFVPAGTTPDSLGGDGGRPANA